jgi:hypothetical protein
MKISSALVVAALAGAALVAPSLTTPAAADDLKPVVVTGDIVRYEPGHMIVLRNASNQEVTYTLTPSVTVPEGVAVGRRVTLYTSRGDDGSSTVTRVTTSVTPEGNVQRTVERTRTNAAGETSTSTSTNIIGTVQAYQPGHSVTITREDGSQYTYTINERTHFPSDLAVGRTIVVHPMTVTDSADRVADTITYTETKTKVKNGHTETKTKTKTKKVSSNN